MNNYIFVAVGSYEQHGSHLPPNTDYLIAEKILNSIAPAFGGKIIEGIKVGISVEHEGFKNTNSISPVKFKIQIKELLSKFPMKSKFIFVNAHGGNNKTLNSIQKNYKDKILVLNTFSLIKNELRNIRTSKIGGICHAGEFETSIMLYLYPRLVRLEKLEKRNVKYIPFLDPNYKKEKLRDWKTIDYNKFGILGDPFHASIKKGELWYNSLIKNGKSLIKKFIKLNTICSTGS